MRIDLSTLPIQFINGIDKIMVKEDFDTTDGYGTKGSVYINRTGNEYVIVCGGSYMNKNGTFNMYPLDEKKEKLFYKERTFSSLEDAWNTFAEYYKI